MNNSKVTPTSCGSKTGSRCRWVALAIVCLVLLGGVTALLILLGNRSFNRLDARLDRLNASAADLKRPLDGVQEKLDVARRGLGEVATDTTLPARVANIGSATTRLRGEVDETASKADGTAGRLAKADETLTGTGAQAEGVRKDLQDRLGKLTDDLSKATASGDGLKKTLDGVDKKMQDLARAANDLDKFHPPGGTPSTSDGGSTPPGPGPKPDGGSTPPGPGPKPDGGSTPPGPGPKPDGGSTPPGPGPKPDGGSTPPDPDKDKPPLSPEELRKLIEGLFPDVEYKVVSGQPAWVPRGGDEYFWGWPEIVWTKLSGDAEVDLKSIINGRPKLVKAVTKETKVEYEVKLVDKKSGKEIRKTKKTETYKPGDESVVYKPPEPPPKRP